MDYEQFQWQRACWKPFGRSISYFAYLIKSVRPRDRTKPCDIPQGVLPRQYGEVADFVFSFFVFNFSKSPTGGKGRPILTHDGSDDALLLKDVPFWVT
jgi:hypothetical protein